MHDENDNAEYEILDQKFMNGHLCRGTISSYPEVEIREFIKISSNANLSIARELCVKFQIDLEGNYREISDANERVLL